MAPGQIKVNIFGSEYTLVSDDDDNYVYKIAKSVDEKMREIDRSHKLKSPTKVAILAALNFAEELYQERLYREKLLNQVNEEARKMNRTLADLLEG